jgi:hypothetical protein
MSVNVDLDLLTFGQFAMQGPATAGAAPPVDHSDDILAFEFVMLEGAADVGGPSL